MLRVTLRRFVKRAPPSMLSEDADCGVSSACDIAAAPAQATRASIHGMCNALSPSSPVSGSRRRPENDQEDCPENERKRVRGPGERGAASRVPAEILADEDAVAGGGDGSPVTVRGAHGYVVGGADGQGESRGRGGRDGSDVREGLN